MVNLLPLARDHRGGIWSRWSVDLKPLICAQSRYQTYGFAQVWNDHDRMSAAVRDILEMISFKVNFIGFGD
ncbi:hypothetical protein ABK905_02015 [Acerihabitans sp. KWT182]|uniref:Uncharacterized protein n=1 Tax=Acerihabitans sp. KWT182 TaxID=3157919 RepID=A0AAU7QAG5_9GAMM